MKKFGDFLSSRPAGREAYLSAQAYIFPSIDESGDIELDFEGVFVLAPSWADEFVTPLTEKWGDRVHCVNTENSSVRATLEFLKQIPSE
ncbi:DUF4325 domain-containing protein [Candidatus Uhrbacteria bacterium]|nr:DUF4325 domain-containing protein [Candidatus Uhrbacteria bacterium]